MAGRLAGKTALITGAAQGIGRASAELFAAEGARVIATDLQPGACADVQGCEPRPLDVTDGPAVRALADALGPIDVLFNCAGWVHAGTILDCDDDAWDRSFTINAKAMFLTIKAFLPGMIARGGGSIVNIGSSCYHMQEDFFPGYAIAKSGVEGLTRTMARTFGPHNVRMNCVLPGWVATERQLEKWWTPEGEAGTLRDQALKRRIAPEEFAQMVLFLAADDGGACTAQSFLVDGGRF
jgi:NAD(P)-dependent dehydrogenase (short-subunit alcohol dehydrogenase family)